MVAEAKDPVLTAYRHVLENDEKTDESGLEKVARNLLKGDPKDFMRSYRQLEREEAEGGAAAGVKDEKSARLIELAEKLLAEAGV